MKKLKRKVVSAAVVGAIGMGAAAGSVLAASYFSGPQATTSCPSGYACVEGNVRTQGYNYGKTEFGWYPISFDHGESNPTRRVRNRNSSTSRPVVIWTATSGGSGYYCRRLEYDNRTWVGSDGFSNATYMNVTTGGYSCPVL